MSKTELKVLQLGFITKQITELTVELEMLKSIVSTTEKRMNNLTNGVKELLDMDDNDYQKFLEDYDIQDLMNVGEESMRESDIDRVNKENYGYRSYKPTVTYGEWEFDEEFYCEKFKPIYFDNNSESCGCLFEDGTVIYDQQPITTLNEAQTEKLSDEHKKWAKENR